MTFEFVGRCRWTLCRCRERYSSAHSCHCHHLPAPQNRSPATHLPGMRLSGTPALARSQPPKEATECSPGRRGASPGSTASPCHEPPNGATETSPAKLVPQHPTRKIEWHNPVGSETISVRLRVTKLGCHLVHHPCWGELLRVSDTEKTRELPSWLQCRPARLPQSGFLTHPYPAIRKPLLDLDFAEVVWYSSCA